MVIFFGFALCIELVSEGYACEVVHPFLHCSERYVGVMVELFHTDGSEYRQDLYPAPLPFQKATLHLRSPQTMPVYFRTLDGRA